jgi:hypothetical protein
MPVERLLASYIVRVVVRAGTRHITLHEVSTGESRTFTTYKELLEHLDERDEAAARQAFGEAP